MFDGVNLSTARQEPVGSSSLSFVFQTFLYTREHYFTIGCDAPNATQVAECSLPERKAISAQCERATDAQRARKNRQPHQRCHCSHNGYEKNAIIPATTILMCDPRLARWQICSSQRQHRHSVQAHHRRLEGSLRLHLALRCDSRQAPPGCGREHPVESKPGRVRHGISLAVQLSRPCEKSFYSQGRAAVAGR